MIDALSALYKIDSMDTPNISQDIVEVTRSISSTKGCETALATGQTILMLRRAAELCKKDKKTMYNIAVILYR